MRLKILISTLIVTIMVAVGMTYSQGDAKVIGKEKYEAQTYDMEVKDPKVNQNPSTYIAATPANVSEKKTVDDKNSSNLTKQNSRGAVNTTLTNTSKSTQVEAKKVETKKEEVKVTTAPAPVVKKVPDIPTNFKFKYFAEVEKQILYLVNIERQKVGLKALTWDSNLNMVARYKANEMLQYNYFAHKSPYTGMPWELAEKMGYNNIKFGENIYRVRGLEEEYITAQNIVDAWMNSESHKANILNVKYNKMSAGVVYSEVNLTCCVSQMFSD